MMPLKMTPARIVVFALMAFMAILWLQGLLNTSWLVIFMVAIAALLLWDSGRRVQITLTEARAKGMIIMKEEQRARRIEEGDLKILPESELKNLLVHGGEKTTIEPEKFHMLFAVESERTFYYLMKMSIFGDWTGITEKKRKVSIERLGEEYQNLGAAPEYVQRQATAGERAGESGPPPNS